MNSSFQAAGWCRGPHAQTIWAALLRPVPNVVLRRERWETPDGDFLDLDFLDGDVTQPLWVALHGLEGSSRSKIVLGFMAAAQKEGWRGLAVNFRSCSGDMNRHCHSYHGGETSDLDWIIRHLILKNSGVKIFCTGASIGGNILLKYLGEKGESLPEQIVAAAAISTPFDLEQSAHALEKGFAQIYMARLVRSLKSKTRKKLINFPGRIDVRALRRVKTMAEFDALVTAPIHGFKDAKAYWSNSSSASFLSRVQRPTLLINAKDDPFLPEIALPIAAVNANPFLQAEFTRQGGHLGFIGGKFWSPRSWAEERVVEFFKQEADKRDRRAGSGRSL